MSTFPWRAACTEGGFVVCRNDRRPVGAETISYPDGRPVVFTHRFQAEDAAQARNSQEHEDRVRRAVDEWNAAPRR